MNISLTQKSTKNLFKILSKNCNNFVNILVAVFFLLGLMGILHHSMWRDELNPWLIARDTGSILDLFPIIKYEGHPGLWYICLYLLNQIVSNPVAMQLFHLLLATASVYIFVKFSPFTNLQKLLFSFGYLPFYEYLIISRNYAIGILLIFAFCALFPTRKTSYFWLSILLFLLANSNAYCLFISIALGLTLIFEYSLGGRITKSLLASRDNIICSLTIFVLGVISSLVQLIPPSDSTLQGGLDRWMLRFDFQHLAKALCRVWNGYILILVSSDRFLDRIIFASLSLGLIAFSSTLLIRKPVALFFYLLGTMEILAFTYVKLLGSARHYGHLYIVLIVSLWIASYYSKSNFFTQVRTINLLRSFPKVCWRWMSFVKKFKTPFIMIILSAQLIGGIFTFSRDLFVPYSASRETARFIQNQHLEQSFIVGSRDANTSPLCGYLNRKFYYPERQGIGSFVLFNNQRRDVDVAIVLEQVSQLIKQKNTNILLVLNSELKTPRAELRITPLAKFTKSFIHNEKYYLYDVSPAVKT
jgi:hypothetical protein